MGKAEVVAEDLVQFFRAHGRYEDISAEGGEDIAPAVASGRKGYGQVEAFGGLAVRAVGAADGDKPRCYVYVTRSSKKLEKQLPTKVGDVSIIVRKVGRMQVRPEAAAGSNTSGSVDRDSKGRIRCGTSIAPAGANFSGTLGALLKDKKGRTLALSNNHVIGGCNHSPKGQPITSPYWIASLSFVAARWTTLRPSGSTLHWRPSTIRSSSPRTKGRTSTRHRRLITPNKTCW
jgi:hypothetical protein